jgi:F-box and leucine-rich repeat protein GRR1
MTRLTFFSITDDAILRLSKSCTRLRYVDVANCAHLTDASVIALATSLPKLRRIGLVKVCQRCGPS